MSRPVVWIIIAAALIVVVYLFLMMTGDDIAEEQAGETPIEQDATPEGGVGTDDDAGLEGPTDAPAQTEAEDMSPPADVPPATEDEQTAN